MVVFDSATLLLHIDPQCAGPTDTSTGQPLTDCKARVDHLLKTLDEARTRILIPTPVLSELLVGAGPHKREFLNEFHSTHVFLVGAFDERAAIELAFLEEADLRTGRRLTGNETRAKVRFDRQITSIAIVNGATTLYTGDRNLAQFAKNNGIDAVMTWELPLPPGNLSLFGESG